MILNRYIEQNLDFLKFIPAGLNDEDGSENDENRPRTTNDTEIDELAALGGPGSGRYPKGSGGGLLLSQSKLAKAQQNPLAHPTNLMGLPDTMMGDATVIDEGHVRNYVAAYGEECKPAKLPKGIKRGVPGECYKNASLLLMRDSSLTYVEGFARPQQSGEMDVAYLHGWIVDKNGNVIDNTWPHPEHNQYFGVRYDRMKYLEHIYKARMYGVLSGSDKLLNETVTTGGTKLRT